MVHQCAIAIGFSSIEDKNSPDALCDGISSLDSAVDNNRQRVSTLEGYLPKTTVLERQSNLTICTGAIVTRLEFSHDRNKPRAEKVHLKPTDSNSEASFSVSVSREVIVSSGAIGSPQVLMLRYDALFRSRDII